MLHLAADIVCCAPSQSKLTLQVSDAYVGLDQMFWLDTYTSQQQTQPMDSSTGGVGDAKGTSKGADRRGDHHGRARGRGGLQKAA